ncbi:hypothetical protein ZIOFF_025123 [Zingiber officinale]|uniref:Uncharacterized protein n=1 Tax=Zingiber officinale TaxID=94328 RepID=A0A8J5H0B5_ZINOF|nr:hypothetical protein ZIOFF_025123 [Zingiber officinale]
MGVCMDGTLCVNSQVGEQMYLNRHFYGQCNIFFRLYERSAFEDAISSCVSKGYVFQMEIIVRDSRKGYHIEEAR